VLIIFYFIGLIAGKVINKAVREKTADKKEEISTEKAEEDVGRRPKEEESNSAEL
jgi:F0F1-type ATP synthase assembly protein I